MKIVETVYGLGKVVGYEAFRADGSAFMVPAEKVGHGYEAFHVDGSAFIVPAEKVGHDKGRIFVQLARPWCWPAHGAGLAGKRTAANPRHSASKS